ncbi:MAG: hypothetical protein QG620_197 [Patescibacteria group bacterium]|nr:hypothetical protein [Patescibacteria group bacterium]
MIINEVMVEKEDESRYEFIELYNLSNLDISLSDYKLTKKASTGTESSLISSSKFSGTIRAHDYFLIAHPDYKTAFFADLAYSGSSYSISTNNTVILYDNNEKVIDKIGFGIAKDYENLPYPNPGENQSIERKNFQDTDNNSEDFNILDVPTPTHGQPEEENDDENNDDEKLDYAGKITINELLPSPSNGEKEFIELLNLSGEKIDIFGWYVLDEKNNKKVLAKEKTGVTKYFHKYDSFSLNSTGDTVSLYDENNKLVDEIKYDKAKSKYAYAFDGSSWRWTSKLTPGAENEFDPTLSGRVKKDKNIYANIYANFEASDVHKNAKKFTWDFGDGHKSYLKVTRHKYEKAGKYQASLKITGDGEDALYDFEVKVEKYPQPDVRITKISPNPKGKDTGNEWIEIENKTKKKVNLKNWSIATGTKNLVNHPIREDFEIKAGKTKKLTREICAFTLANVKTKIELRSPDGKVVQKLNYDKKKEKMEEYEIYEKGEDGWEWVAPPAETDLGGLQPQTSEVASSEQDSAENTGSEKNNNANINLTEEEITAALGKYTPAGDWEEKKRNRNNLVNYGVTIKLAGADFTNQPRVLGASAVKQYENFYTFTAPAIQKHWAIALFNAFWTKINSGLNWAINRI